MSDFGLPEGFVLDAPLDTSAAAPSPAPDYGLPAGFVLDNLIPAAASAASPAPGSSWNNFKSGISALIDQPSRIMDVGPLKLAKEMAQGAVSGATLPGDVVLGKVDPMSDEGVSRSFDLAGLAPMMPFGKAIAPEIAAAAPALRPGAQAVENAATLGIPIPRLAATDSRALQSLGQASRQLPIAGGMVEKAADRFTAGLADAAKNIGSGLTETVGLDKAALGNQLRTVVEKAASNLDEANHAAFGNLRSMVETTKPVKEGLGPIQDVLADVMTRRQAAGETSIGQLKPLANLLQRPGGVTFDGLQRARSQIGKAIRFDERSGGFEQGDLKQAYGALSQAMEATVRGAAKADPEVAVGALKAANSRFSENADTLSSLGKALRSPSDEALANQVLGMAGERSGNAQRLIALQQQIGADNMKSLGAHVLEQAGKAGDGWSAARFSTNLEKLSPTAKTVLFGETRPQVEALTALASRWKGLEASFANKSNTGRAAMTGAALGSAGTALADPFTMLAKAVGTAGGGLGLGWYMSRPATARAAVQTARAYERMMTEGTKASENAFYALQRQFVIATAKETARAANSNVPTQPKAAVQ